MYAIAFDVFAGQVGGKTSDGWNGADRNGRRSDRDGVWRSETGETRLCETSSSRGGTGQDQSWQKEANGTGRGRTTDAGGV